MNKLNVTEEIVFNEGERLIPGVTHDLAEAIRHKSSYLFFQEVIRRDLLSSGKKPVTIIDLGCGVGHGCVTLACIANSVVTGVDNSAETVQYAQQHYAMENITYQRVDLVEFIPSMPEYDYVVSRGVLEHVPDGLNLAFRSNWRKRLMFDVPYAEPAGRNPHHIIHDIDERTFQGVPGVELFYEDLQGNIYDMAHKPARSNLIMCIMSHPDLPLVGSLRKFPVPAVQTLAESLILKWRNQWAPSLATTVRMPGNAVRRALRLARDLFRASKQE